VEKLCVVGICLLGGHQKILELIELTQKIHVITKLRRIFILLKLLVQVRILCLSLGLLELHLKENLLLDKIILIYRLIS